MHAVHHTGYGSCPAMQNNHGVTSFPSRKKKTGRTATLVHYITRCSLLQGASAAADLITGSLGCMISSIAAVYRH
jgi:hypothetical protein